MFIDYAYADFRALVASATGLTPVWAPYTGPISYPWCALQVVAGPNSAVEQIRIAKREICTVTVAAGVNGDEVSCLISGRYLAVTYATSASATATALAALAPSHWTVSAVGAVVTISGPDVFGGFAISGCTLARAVTGQWLNVEIVRRTATVQASFWHTEPRRWLAAPAGVDSSALAVRDAISRRSRLSTIKRAYMRPLAPTPSTWQGADGKAYVGSVLRVELAWTDLVTSGDPADLADVDTVAITYPP